MNHVFVEPRAVAARFAWIAVCTFVASGCGGCGPEPSPSPDAGDAALDGAIADADSDVDAGGSDADAGNPIQSITSLTAPVTVRYDEHGVPHIECAQRRDCLVVEGYLHARDRFLQMDLTRHQTRGRLSEMIGHGLGLGSDIAWRRRLLTPEGEPLENAYWDILDDETKDVFEAYAEGVNAWLGHARRGQFGARLSAEYDSPLLYGVDDIPDWEPQDSLSPFFQLAYAFSFSETDLLRGERAAALSPEQGADLAATASAVDSSIVPVAQTTALSGPLAPRELGGEWVRSLASRRDLLEAGAEQMRSHPSILLGQVDIGHGSNSWVVGPSRSASGFAILENDPHLNITNPSIWYLVQMKSTDGNFQLTGASIPGGPGIVTGQNGKISWGTTIAVLDLGDVYVETLTADKAAVERDGERVELISREYEFHGRDGAAPRTEVLQVVPGHGPLVAVSEDGSEGLSVRWNGYDVAADLEFLPALWAANNVAEAGEALEKLRIINVSWSVADVAGDIGWFPTGAVPSRPWASASLAPWLPLPGDGTAEWDGYLAPEQIPTLHNPPADFIVTANNDFNGSWEDGDGTNDASPYLQIPLPVDNFRHRRISDLINQTPLHTVESFLALQADSHSMPAEVLVPQVLETAATIPNLSSSAQGIVDALTGWDFTCPSGLDGNDAEASPVSTDSEVISRSAACLAFHTLMIVLIADVFDEASAVAPDHATMFWKDFVTLLLLVFEEPDGLQHGEQWFDRASTPAMETRDEIVASALERTAQWIEQKYGTEDRSQWAWGRVHALTVASILGLSQYSGGTYATGGGFQTVDMGDQAFGQTEVHHGHPAGASVRLIHEMKPEGVETWFQLPGGQSHDRDSPFYMSLIDRWLDHEPARLLEDQAEIEAATVETLVIEAP